MAKVKKVSAEEKIEMEKIDREQEKINELAKHGGFGTNLFRCPFCKKDHSDKFNHNQHFKSNLDVICECGAELRFVTNYEVLTVPLELPYDWKIGGK